MPFKLGKLSGFYREKKCKRLHGGPGRKCKRLHESFGMRTVAFLNRSVCEPFHIESFVYETVS